MIRQSIDRSMLHTYHFDPSRVYYSTRNIIRQTGTTASMGGSKRVLEQAQQLQVLHYQDTHWFWEVNNLPSFGGEGDAKRRLCVLTLRGTLSKVSIHEKNVEEITTGFGCRLQTWNVRQTNCSK